jgi:RimJ/RimL family protein N-acetyltransferase
VIIETDRLILRPWRDGDRAQMAAMLADPEVMWDWERTFTRAESDAAIDRYHASFLRSGFGRFPVLDKRDDKFLGYCGIMRLQEGQPLAPALDIGWRFTRAAWGHGYATESARACLQHGFEQCGFAEVMAKTRHDNIRSQNVMKRLGMTFLPELSWEEGGQRHVAYAARR